MAKKKKPVDETYVPKKQSLTERLEEAIRTAIHSVARQTIAGVSELEFEEAVCAALDVHVDGHEMRVSELRREAEADDA